MPNWCENNLTIEGDEASLAAFRVQAHGRMHKYVNYYETDAWPVYDDVRIKALLETDPEESSEVVAFSFHALYPVPSDFLRFPYDDNSAIKLGEKVGDPRPYGGYKWENLHWGCKWGASDSELISKTSGSLQYYFSTAWSPPSALIMKVSRDYPSLTFTLEYSEEGMGFEGHETYKNGESIEERQEFDNLPAPAGSPESLAVT